MSCLSQLERNGILHYCFIDGDADSVIAGLARHMECVIMSNDTDFLLYDLPENCGLILLDDELASKIIR